MSVLVKLIVKILYKLSLMCLVTARRLFYLPHKTQIMYFSSISKHREY